MKRDEVETAFAILDSHSIRVDKSSSEATEWVAVLLQYEVAEVRKAAESIMRNWTYSRRPSLSKLRIALVQARQRSRPDRLASSCEYCRRGRVQVPCVVVSPMDRSQPTEQHIGDPADMPELLEYGRPGLLDLPCTCSESNPRAYEARQWLESHKDAAVAAMADRVARPPPAWPFTAERWAQGLSKDPSLFAIFNSYVTEMIRKAKMEGSQ